MHSGLDGDEQLTVDIQRPAAGTAVLTVRGDLDMLTAPQLRAAVQHGLAGTPELLVIDLDDVGFLGTTGLALLVEIRSTTRDAGTALRLVCTKRSVLRPLELTGLTGLLTVCDSVTEALADSGV